MIRWFIAKAHSRFAHDRPRPIDLIQVQILAPAPDPRLMIPARVVARRTRLDERDVVGVLNPRGPFVDRRSLAMNVDADMGADGPCERNRIGYHGLKTNDLRSIFDLGEAGLVEERPVMRAPLHQRTVKPSPPVGRAGMMPPVFRNPDAQRADRIQRMSDNPEEPHVRRPCQKRRQREGQPGRGRIVTALPRDLERHRPREVRADDLRERRLTGIGIAGQPIEQLAEYGRAAPSTAEDQDGW